MRNCNCNRDFNITDAQIQIRSPHDISIKIDREANNPTIESLRKRIEDLEVFNLHIDDEVERLLGEKLQQLDIVTKAALTELLVSYSTKEDLVLLQNNLMTIIAQEREYNDARYLQKAYVTQEQYDEMSENDKKQNTIYIIRN